MATLQSCLESILQRQFHIIQARTNRHDQWYKRTYQSWKDKNGDCEPLILSPKTSREEWSSEMRTAALGFATTIERDAEQIYEQERPAIRSSRDKLFADSVFDMPLGILGPEYVHDSPLKPTMQRTSYWTSASKNSRHERQNDHRTLKALLICEQIEPLCHLAHCAQSRIKAAAHVEDSFAALGTSRRLDIGWDSTVDEILEQVLALMILKYFSESLNLETAYQTWVPFAFAQAASAHCHATTAERFKSMLDEQGENPTTHQNMQDIINRCQRILVATQALVSACGMPPINWERRFASAFLHFVGFECWNREREGVRYLGCDFNVRKDGKLLLNMSSSEAKPDEPATETKVRRSRDPLLLHEARRQDVEESEWEERDDPEELAGLEAQEMAYGLKRSTKYRQRPHGTGIESS